MHNPNFLLLILLALSNVGLGQQTFAYWGVTTLLEGDTLSLLHQSDSTSVLKWQKKDRWFSTWSDIDNSASDSLSITSLVSSQDTIYYRAVLETLNDSCPGYSTIIRTRVISVIDEINYRDRFRNGLVFFDTLSRLFIASESSLQPVQWGCQGTEIPGANSQDIGEGRQNTDDIKLHCSDSLSIVNRLNEYLTDQSRDWYIPASRTLRKLIDSLYGNPLPSIAINHWSSTQDGSHRAFCYREISGGPRIQATAKFLDKAVHPVLTLHKSEIRNSNIYCKTKPSPLATENLILVELDTNHSTNVQVLYTGLVNLEDSLVWDFGSGTVVAGSGLGPIELTYPHGGPHTLRASVYRESCIFMNERRDVLVDMFRETNSDIVGAHLGSVHIEDLNDDELLDLIIVDNDSSFVLQGVSGDQYMLVQDLGLRLSESTSFLMDVDNNGRLDLFVSGFSLSDSMPSSHLFLQDSFGVFEETPHDIEPLYKGCLTSADINNDGFIDLIICGIDSFSSEQSLIYINDGIGGFTLVDTMPGLSRCAIDLGDYDSNGWPDIIATGRGDSIRKTVLYSNFEGVFKKENPSFYGEPLRRINLDDGDIKWADLDNDGRLDIIMTGLIKDVEQTNNSVALGPFPTFQVYKQEDSITFHGKGYSVNFRGLGRALGEIDVADCNNDGLADVAVTGVPGGLAWIVAGTGGGTRNAPRPDDRSKPGIFVNIGDMDFTNIRANIPYNYDKRQGREVSIQNFRSGIIKFKDLDKDGDVDLLRSGRSETVIYQNDMDIPLNRPPQLERARIKSIVSCDSIQLLWELGLDDLVPSNVLTYTVYIGSAPGQCDIVSKANNYELQIPSFKLKRTLPQGTYYWSVRAKDNALNYSEWAPEQTFTIGFPIPPTITQKDSLLISEYEDGNQWHDQDGPIPGAVGKQYSPERSAQYYSVVIKDGCWVDTTNVIDFRLTSVSDHLFDGIKVYPNPFENSVVVSADFPIGQYTIVDRLGRAVMSGTLPGDGHIELDGLLPGSYVLKLQDEHGAWYLQGILKK